MGGGFFYLYLIMRKVVGFMLVILEVIFALITGFVAGLLGATLIMMIYLLIFG